MLQALILEKRQTHHHCMQKDLSGLPPAIVLTAGHDPLREEGEAYAAKLVQAGVPTIFKRYEDQFHGFFTMVGFLPASEKSYCLRKYYHQKQHLNKKKFIKLIKTKLKAIWKKVKTKKVEALVVGAGFSGLYLTYRFQQRGVNVLTIEAGDGVGGTWYWNRYPGARVDVLSVEYSYSFSKRIAGGVELDRKNILLNPNFSNTLIM